MEKTEFVFTAENLLDNIEKLGGWSAYGLASIALEHYFPSEYNEDGECSLQREIELMSDLGCQYWCDAIKKYHTEVGYTGFDPRAVNEY